MRAHPGDLQQVRIDGLLDGLHTQLLAEVVRPQQAEVIVRVNVVQGQDQVDQRLAAAAVSTRAAECCRAQGVGAVLTLGATLGAMLTPG